MELNFTAIAIAALVGTIMTLIFAYFPVVRVWYASLATEKASLLKLGVMLSVELILGGLSFIPGIVILQPPFTVQQALAVALALIITNQPIAALLPAPGDVREAIRIRTAKFLRG